MLRIRDGLNITVLCSRFSLKLHPSKTIRQLNFDTIFPTHSLALRKHLLEGIHLMQAKETKLLPHREEQQHI